MKRKQKNLFFQASFRGLLFFVIGALFIFLNTTEVRALQNSYSKLATSTLTANEWNLLAQDFVHQNPGGLSALLNASNVTPGEFGSNVGSGGNYIFGATQLGNVGIGTSTLASRFHIYDASSGPIITLSGLNTNYRGLTVKDIPGAEQWFYGLNDKNNFTVRRSGTTDYLSIASSTGYVGVGVTNPGSILTVPNNQWLSAVNSAGTGFVNMLRVNANDELELGGSLNIGQFQFSEDSGFNTLVDMPVSALPAVGTVEGYAMKVDGDNILSVYSEANGTGGVTNKRVGIGTSTPAFTLDVAGTVNASALYVNGAPYVGSQWTTLGSNIYYNTGNVGIGTTTPSSAGLVVTRSINNYSIDAGNYRIGNVGTPVSDFDAVTKSYLDSSLSSSSATIITQIATSSLWQGSLTGNIYNANTGNIGIGTTNPTSPLHLVYNGADTTNPMTIDASGSTLDTKIVFGVRTPATGAQKAFALWKGADANAFASFEYNIGGAGKPGFTFGPGGSSSRDVNLYRDSSNVLRTEDTLIADSGIGIGITNPATKLDIFSAVAAGNNLKVQTVVTGAEPSVTVDFWLQNLSTGGSNAKIEVKQTDYQNNALIFSTETANVMAERMRIHTNGNVGIATTTPTSAKLVIGVATNNYTIDAGTYRIGNVGTPVSAADAVTKSYLDSAVSTAQSAFWNLSGSNLFASSTSWNVGIGTTNPSVKLDVAGDARIVNSSLQLKLVDSDDSRTWGLNANASIFSIYDQANSASPFTISGINPNGTLYLSSGNVGVGTTNPAYSKLDIGGTSQINGAIYPFVGITNTADNIQALQLQNKSTGANAEMRFITAANDGSYMAFTQPSSNNSGTFFGATKSTGSFIFNSGNSATTRDLYIGTTDAKSLFFGTNNLTRAVILSNGNVGIATTTPTSAKLVIGDATNNYTIDAGTYRIGNVGTPISDSDAVTKSYLDSAVSTAQSAFWNLSGSNLFASSTSWNVGIGTTAPSQQLEITKNFRMPNTVGAAQGVIYINSNRFIHTQGSNNHFFGLNAGNFTLTGSLNLAFGGEALLGLTSGTENMAFGHGSMRSNTTGSQNTALGRSALRNNLIGVNNIAIGNYALLNNTGSLNTAIGWQAMTANTSGFNNTAIGEEALYTNTTGSNNTVLGYFAGSHTSDGLGNLNSSNSVYVGANVRGGSISTETNAIVIGYDAIGAGSNSVVLGNDSILNTILKGNVGIATTTPTSAKLVIGDATNNYTIDAGNYRIGNVGTPTISSDAATKSYVDSLISSSTGAIAFWGGEMGGNLWNLNTGNVGIGTTNPGTLLDLQKDTSSGSYGQYPSFTVSNLNTTGTSYAAAQFRSGNVSAVGVTGLVGRFLAYSNNNAGQYFGIYSASSTYPLYLGNNNNDLTIKSGNVGIGTTAPDTKLSFGNPGENTDVINIYQDTSGRAGIGTYGIAGLKIYSYNSSYDVVIGQNQGSSRTLSPNMIIKGSGNVGIATTTPTSAKLVIGDATNNYTIDAGTYRIGNVGTPTSASDAVTKSYLDSAVSTAQSAFWNLSGSNLYASSTSWNVGIGITNPGVPLVVNGAVRLNITSDYWGFGNTGVSMAGPIGLYSNAVYQYTANNTIAASYTFGDGNGKWSLTKAAGANPDFKITSIGSGAFGDSLTVKHTNGNIGIGTTAPGAKLHILSATSTPYKALVLDNDSTVDGSGSIIHFVSSSDENVGAQIAGGREGAGGTSYLKFTNYLSGTGFVERMRITGSGNVGIATTTPTSAKLVIGAATNNYTIDAGTYRIGNVGTPVSDSDAVTKSYLDSAVSTAQSAFWNLSGSNLFASSTDWKVGIGTTNPTSTLSVVGDIDATSLCIAGDCRTSWGLDSWNLDGNTAGQMKTFGTNDNYSIPFVTNNVERMRLTNTGNLVLGATSTGVRLHVESPAGSVAFFKSSLNGGSYSGYLGNGQTFSGEEFGLYSSVFSSRLAVYDVANSLSLYGGYGTTDVGIAINATGNVGIATTTPTSAKLVIGDATNNYTIDAGTYRIGNVGTPISDSDAVTKSYLDSAVSTAQSAFWNLSGSNLFASSTSWNVGIGTTAPSQQLEITKNFQMPNTTNPNKYGIIYKGASPFIHDFNYGDNGTAITSGNNTFIGLNAGNLTMGATATTSAQSSANTIVGSGAFFQNTTGYANSALGSSALFKNTTGYENVAQGAGAMLNNTTGYYNTANGSNALYKNTTGFYNVAIGQKAAYENTLGSYNTVLGARALGSKTGAGSSNVVIGYQAGTYQADGVTALASATSSIYIGTNARGYNNSDNNSIVIGDSAIGIGANSVVLGNDNILTTLLKGNVGIGTTTPTSAKLVIGSATNNYTIDAGTYRIGNIGTPISDSDAVTKSYLDSAVSTAQSAFWNLSGSNLFASSTSWNVGIGTTDPGSYRLKVAGDVAITGTLQTQTGSDFAEEFSVMTDLTAGTVVVMADDGHKSVRASDRAYDNTVVGIVSDNPSIIAGKIVNKKKAIIAMMGVVSVNVTNDNGQIKKGDLLTTANLEGYAMKATDFRPGTVLGKALENLSGKKGKIKVLVNLQ